MDLEYWVELEEQEPKPKPPKRRAVTASLADDEEAGPTGPLESFFTDLLIVGEPSVVKSGKEASVYCCQAHPRLGVPLLAAKVYKPRQQRNFKKDGIYQQGRTTLDTRADRAIANRTKKGMGMQFGMWIGCEMETLSRLHAAGADVPKPYGSASSALLLDYYGEVGMAAPQLYTVELSAEEAPRLFDQLLRNLAIFLECDRVHGDLSPYNILYWQGSLKIIDFPQAVDPAANRQAFSLFERDVANVCEYFAGYGLEADPPQLARRLWRSAGWRLP